MEIRLDQIPDDRLEWRERFTIEAAELDHPDLRSLDDVELRGTVTRTDEQSWFFDGDLAYQRTLACVRCLETSSEEIRTRVQLVVTVDEDADDAPAADDEEHELEQGDLGLLELREPELDTRPLVVEQIQLAIPMKPLCRDDCAGLCPRCGADLNRQACNCPEEIDPRWAALSALRQVH